MQVTHQGITPELPLHPKGMKRSSSKYLRLRPAPNTCPGNVRKKGSIPRTNKYKDGHCWKVTTLTNERTRMSERRTPRGKEAERSTANRQVGHALARPTTIFGQTHTLQCLPAAAEKSRQTHYHVRPYGLGSTPSLNTPDNTMYWDYTTKRPCSQPYRTDQSSSAQAT